jgi:mycothiol synthase
MKQTKRNRNIDRFTARAATLEDVDLVVNLANAAALEDTGMLDTTREDKLIEWGLPQFSLADDSHLLLAPDGQAAGFVELWDSEPHVRHMLWGRVHPDHRGLGLGSRLMEWAEARARQGLHRSPPGTRVSIHTSTAHQNKAAHELFQLRGYTPSRHYFRMLIEMAPDTPPPAPVWPKGITVRPYVMGQDDRDIHRAIDEAFQDHWGYVAEERFEEWVHWIENDSTFDPSTCFLALSNESGDEQIVGVLMSRPAWEVDPGIAWIDELGVLRPWRRRGIALALLHQVFGEYHRRAKYKVGLGVDGNSLTGATSLYERAGMHIFHQVDAYEKILRSGQDLSTQSLED